MVLNRAPLSAAQEVKMGEVAGAQQALEKSAYAAESKARAHPRVALSGGFPLGACAVRATALGPKVRKTFRLFDYNADGRISVDEFKVGRYRAAPGRGGDPVGSAGH